MSLFKDYLRFHADLAVVLYREILCSVDKGLFAALFNFRSAVLRRNAHVEWDGTWFYATDRRMPGSKCRFRHQRAGNMFYERGLVDRARNLGKTYLLDRIDFKDGDVVIDCGANTGDLKLWFVANGMNVEYIAFEPSPVEFECLAANVAPATAHNVGLWNADGAMRFYVCSQNGDSSLIEPPKYDQIIEVETHRLERYLDRKVKCLKLEAEGAEPEILEGAGDGLKFVEYVTADLWYERGVKAESTLAPVTNYLLKHGFELVDIDYFRLCALYRNTSIGS
jgi:FkbM family methyltransferase